jgi:hypothetical protein
MPSPSKVVDFSRHDQASRRQHKLHNNVLTPKTTSSPRPLKWNLFGYKLEYELSQACYLGVWDSMRRANPGDKGLLTSRKFLDIWFLKHSIVEERMEKVDYRVVYLIQTVHIFPASTRNCDGCWNFWQRLSRLPGSSEAGATWNQFWQLFAEAWLSRPRVLTLHDQSWSNYLACLYCIVRMYARMLAEKAVVHLFRKTMISIRCRFPWNTKHHHSG